MPHRRFFAALVVCLPLAVGAGCDRKIEAYDPNEKPETPDLAKIFPPGAEQSAAENPMGAGPAAAPGMRRGPPPAPAAASAEEGSDEPVSGRVVLDPSLADRVPANATLFLIARRGSGGPPLAVKRIASPRFPLEFELGPDDRMIQSMPFAGPLQITARLDQDGNATSRTPGDLQGAAKAPAQPGDSDVEIVIDEAL